MSAEGIGDIVERAVKDTAFDVVIVNFANADMVGHSGKIEPTVRAVETIDAQLGRIYNAVRGANASWIITADHGNAEMLIDPATGGPHTAHTTNPVPFILVTEHGKNIGVREAGRCAISRLLCWGCLDWPAEGDDRARPACTAETNLAAKHASVLPVRCDRVFGYEAAHGSATPLRTLGTPPGPSERLHQDFPAVEAVQRSSYEGIEDYIRDAEVAITFSLRPEQFKAARKLRWIDSCRCSPPTHIS